LGRPVSFALAYLAAPPSLPPAEPALLVPVPGVFGRFGSILSEVPGPLAPGCCVEGWLPLVLLPLLAPCSRRQRVFAAPVRDSQFAVVDDPLVALPDPLVALSAPLFAPAAAAGVSWPLGADPPLAWPNDAVDSPSSAAATAAPSSFIFIRCS